MAPGYINSTGLRAKCRRICRAVASADVISLSSMRQSGCGTGAILYCARKLLRPRSEVILPRSARSALLTRRTNSSSVEHVPTGVVHDCLELLECRAIGGVGVAFGHDHERHVVRCRCRQDGQPHVMHKLPISGRAEVKHRAGDVHRGAVVEELARHEAKECLCDRQLADCGRTMQEY